MYYVSVPYSRASKYAIVSLLSLPFLSTFDAEVPVS
jgi:hypothetical protein